MQITGFILACVLVFLSFCQSVWAQSDSTTTTASTSKELVFKVRKQTMDITLAEESILDTSIIMNGDSIARNPPFYGKILHAIWPPNWFRKRERRL